LAGLAERILPIEMVSAKADRIVVATLRQRYPRSLKNSPS
jgi:hypothetical protein